MQSIRGTLRSESEEDARKEATLQFYRQEAEISVEAWRVFQTRRNEVLKEERAFYAPSREADYEVNWYV